MAGGRRRGIRFVLGDAVREVYVLAAKERRLAVLVRYATKTAREAEVVIEPLLRTLKVAGISVSAD
jgi:hypothetical protein